MSGVQRITLHLSEAAVATGGEVMGADVLFTGAGTDTRTIKSGELFIALRGPNFDGHDFVQQAQEKGATAVLVDHAMDIDIPMLVVKDTRIAMGKLAHAWRKRFNIPVIAVTGSNGKTTVKEMLASIFSETGQVHATKGNLNNDIGVPLTLFELGEQHGSAIIEMGANHAGEIAWLVGLADPDVAVITNAGAAHLEGFGSLEGVARAKGEIYQGLSEKGYAVINADDRFAPLWREFAAPRQRIEFGLNDHHDVTAVYTPAMDGNAITVTTPHGEVQIKLTLLGRHNVMNALAAISAAIVMDVALDDIKAGLEKMRPVPGRLQIKPGINQSRVIDDTYNANPSSVQAALDVVCSFPGRHFLALGDMGELGGDAAAMHRRVGEQAREKGLHGLYTTGELAANAADAFGAAAFRFATQSEMIAALQNDLQADTTLLVKGSRRARMEKVVDALIITERS
ncbi:MAG: UDP-N-acetylmuramoyl-tripeptide--D-alanyl-D-alanine ligase [Gammaproteobacteria bacterium]|nr:UDP-N-acetylmuramoyl-tripeptide--D-alanyl-D-alanine ligase [Gammaproteobacteria bacterium]